MPKVSVYLPDELYRLAREHELSVSTVTQEALGRHLQTRDNTRWIDAAASRQARVTKPVDTTALLDEVREDFGA
jgi:post-segregation antitoxin (ccd killing protein)